MVLRLGLHKLSAIDSGVRSGSAARVLPASARGAIRMGHGLSWPRSTPRMRASRSSRVRSRR
ncbi:hypothetical protein BHS05_10065 [Myxococcus xanthus]|uniref:Uncharacterized protein n=1 Tax=Myxococcus xanthus TaxID=34 RepID=A0AAE6FXX3_MYXXA|nr:hypothetical protein BHS09_10040 [Myxococcus xanthus]QDE74577.1 hypothetical protein BHS08_10050 [Myxococcus xanthus]QDE96164.1 hypothetical protein BHS05_10065 [Myxococcus xanthus]